MNQKPNNAPAENAGASQAPEVPPYVIAKQQKANMIRKMLYYGYMMGWDQPKTELEAKALTKQQLCWNHVEAWCRSKHCKINKSLNRYTVDELVQVLSQFEEVYKAFLKQLKQKE